MSQERQYDMFCMVWWYLFSISRIGDVFIQLVEDDTMNGETIEMHQNGNSRRIAYYERAAITNPGILKFWN